MTLELSDVIPTPDAAPSIRRARVISVSGRTLKVDMGGGIDIPSLDSCNPLPDQWVYIIGEGSSMMAIGAVAGAYRQAALTVTASTTTTVTGIVNGVSTVVSKAGAYTTTAGDILPLLYAADNSKAWALGPGGVPYIPPPTGGGGSGGGGGVTSGTATYAATWGGSNYSSSWSSGPLRLGGNFGAFFYGSGRFRELQGRTITGFRVNVSRQSGGGAVDVVTIPNSGPSSIGSTGPGTSLSPGGWRSLPLGMASYLIAGSGTGGLLFAGSGTLNGLPSGTLQFDWRR